MSGTGDEYGIGTATLSYDDGGTQTHNLVVPLQGVRPASKVRRHVRESLDFQNRVVWHYGSTYEAVATIRMDADPASLLDLIVAGAEGKAITYDDGTGNSIECDMIFRGSDVEDILLGFEESGEKTGEYAHEIRLRKRDGTAWPSDFFDATRFFD